MLSVGSGSATRIPAISRPSFAALTAALASCSAFAPPAETPSTAEVVRIVSGTRGVAFVYDHDYHEQCSTRFHVGMAIVADGDSQVVFPAP